VNVVGSWQLDGVHYQVKDMDTGRVATWAIMLAPDEYLDTGLVAAHANNAEEKQKALWDYQDERQAMIKPENVAVLGSVMREVAASKKRRAETLSPRYHEVKR